MANVQLRHDRFSHYTSALSAVGVCVQCPVWLFSVVPPWFRAFPVCWSGIGWVILRWCQLPLLLPVSLLFSHSTCAGFLFSRNCNNSQRTCSFLALSRIMLSGLLLERVLSIWTCWFHTIVTLTPWLVFDYHQHRHYYYYSNDALW